MKSNYEINARIDKGDLIKEKSNEKIIKYYERDFRDMSFLEIIKNVTVITSITVFVIISICNFVEYSSNLFQPTISNSIVDIKVGYEFVSYMINNIVKEEDMISKKVIEINKDNIDKAIDFFVGKDETLVIELKKWKNGDFSEILNIIKYVNDKLKIKSEEVNDIDYEALNKILFNLNKQKMCS